LKTAGAFNGVGLSLGSSGGAAIGMAAGLAIAYFLAAKLGLALQAQPSDVAVFWPASGVAAGILMLAGRRAYPALLIGVVVGTVAANILNDRNVWTSALKGLCNAGEAVVVAKLLERWFGPQFTFDEFRRVVGFVAVATLAAAMSGVGGAATMTQLHTTAPFWDVWRDWFLSDGIGIVSVAPIVIGFGQLCRQPPVRRELIEGLGALALLVVVSSYVVSHPSESWLSFSPGAAILPLLLWLAARCPPTFAIAGAFFASVAVIGATNFGVGRFGDMAIPLLERVRGAQTAVMTVTVYTLALVALFAAKSQGAQRLVSIVESSDDAIIGMDLNGVIQSWNHGAQQVFGYSAEEVIGKSILILVPPDRKHEEMTIIERIRSGKSVKHYETVRRRKNGVLVDVSLTISPVRDGTGVVVGASKIARDITDRKKAEAALAERTMQLAIAGRAALVGSFAYDVDTERLQITPGYAAIHGFPDGTTEIARREWQAGMHPEDRVRWEALRSRAHRERWQEYSGEYRIVHSGGEVRWIEARVFVSYASDGRPQRAVGVDIDVTARNRADEQQRALNAELDHRVKNLLATVSAIITQTPKAGVALADFVAGFDGRIKSLARTHELLSQSHWQDVSLPEIVRREIAPYAAGNATILGPGVTLKAAAAQAVATVLHELATNAAKYGAFSRSSGRLFVSWCWLDTGSPGRLAFQWQESGGPAVLAPSQTGFGTSVIRELIPFELGGTVDLTFASDGLQCRLEIPADWLSSDAPIGERGIDIEQTVYRN
jgi:PAS domain S-box-containing protein